MSATRTPVRHRQLYSSYSATPVASATRIHQRPSVSSLGGHRSLEVNYTTVAGEYDSQVMNGDQRGYGYHGNGCGSRSRLADDINWTTKYLTVDRPQHGRITSDSSSESDRGAPTFVQPMTRTERDLDLSGTRLYRSPSPFTSPGHEKTSNGFNERANYRSVSVGTVSELGHSHHLTKRTEPINRHKSAMNANRAVTVSPLADKQTSNYPRISPFTAADSAQANTHISDTRRKLRKLLCESRGDPHYFDR